MREGGTDTEGDSEECVEGDIEVLRVGMGVMKMEAGMGIMPRLLDLRSQERAEVLIFCPFTDRVYNISVSYEPIHFAIEVIFGRWN